jgi:hypothetical protein
MCAVLWQNLYLSLCLCISFSASRITPYFTLHSIHFSCLRRTLKCSPLDAVTSFKIVFQCCSSKLRFDCVGLCPGVFVAMRGVDFDWRFFVLTVPYNLWRSRDSSVGIVPGYWLDVPIFESRWGRDFSYTSRPALGPTQPPVQWLSGLFRG